MPSYDIGFVFVGDKNESIIKWLRKESSWRGLKFLWINEANAPEMLQKLEKKQMRVRYLIDNESNYYNPEDIYMKICYAVKDQGGVIIDDPDNQVDQKHYLKSRLVDILIGDWDRHEDQWRWAGFEEDEKVIYKAIPRDRDQTFYLNQGMFPWISCRKFAVRQNQGFDYEIKDMAGLGQQSRHLDRIFFQTE